MRHHHRWPRPNKQQNELPLDATHYLICRGHFAHVGAVAADLFDQAATGE
jgi:hypothetical protein